MTNETALRKELHRTRQLGFAIWNGVYNAILAHPMNAGRGLEWARAMEEAAEAAVQKHKAEFFGERATEAPPPPPPPPPLRIIREGVGVFTSDDMGEKWPKK